MIRHLLKIIWNERKVNSWIILEYICVFCILWFCFDFLTYIGKRYREPLGFDIENVYQLMTQKKDNYMYGLHYEVEVEDFEIATTFLERAKKHPDVLNVCLSSGAVPYLMNRHNSGIRVEPDTINYFIRVRYVSPEFFEVFNLKPVSGNVFEDSNSRLAVLSPDKYGNIGTPYTVMHPGENIKQITLGEEEEEEYKVVGILNPLKDTFYDEYERCIFYPLEKWRHILSDGLTVTLRVKPNVGKDFPQRFMEDMKSQLSIGPYILTSVVPMEKIKKNTIRQSGMNETLNSMYAITFFVIVNIFLGVIGTFWYRTQSRQGEIGLRVSLGSSRRGVRTLLCQETLLLLVIASIIGVNICLNIGQSGVLDVFGIPSPDREQLGINWTQDILNFILTFSFLAIISLLAVWYPAWQGSKVQPAEALREE